MTKIHFRSGDGLDLVGILDEPKAKTNACIILCHGFRLNKDESGNFIALAARLAASGFAVFRFDFRAHGESEGEPVDLTLTGEKEDLEAAFKFLTNKGYSNFGIVAASFSAGSVALFIPAHQEHFKALALLYPRLDFNGFIKKRWLAGGQKELLAKQEFVYYKDFRVGKKLVEEMLKIHPIEELKKLRMPILFVHGDKDQSVPYEESVSYAKILNSKLVTIKGSGHGFFDNEQDLAQAVGAVDDFFIENLSASNKL